MKKVPATTLLIGMIIVLSLQTGCSPQNDGNPLRPGSSETALSDATLTNASVRFQLIFPGRETPNAEILFQLASSPPLVTFELKIVNIGDIANPFTILKKQVVAGSDGSASATFKSIPAKTVIGKVHVSGGNFLGFSEFQGASDLTSGIVLCGLDELKKKVFNMTGILSLTEVGPTLEEAARIARTGS